MPSKRSTTFALVLAFAVGFPASAQLQPPRTIILIGPPGSGKTVQAEALRKTYKIPAISMAQLLHREINRQSTMGNALAASLDSGELLGDDSANELMKARLLRPDAARGFILDGYPSTEVQAKALDKWLSEHNLPKPIVVILDVSAEVSRERMIRRGRVGDTPANIERRLRDYREVGQLVEKWYGAQRLVRADGTGAPSEVALRIAKGVDAVQSSPSLKVRPLPSEEPRLKQREPASGSEQKQ